MPTDPQSEAAAAADMKRIYSAEILRVMNARGEMAIHDLLDLICQDEGRSLVRAALSELISASRLELCGKNVIMPQAQREELTPYSGQEACEKLVRHFIGLADYWSREARGSEREKMIGLVHSILATLDGSTVGFPAFDLVPSCAEGDAEFLGSLGERWFPDRAINSDTPCTKHSTASTGK